VQNRGRSTAATTRSEIAAGTTTLSDGCILVVGGSLPGIKPSANVLVYDPAADAWAKLAPLPQPWKGAVARQVGEPVVTMTRARRPPSMLPARLRRLLSGDRGLTKPWHSGGARRSGKLRTTCRSR